MEYARLGDYVNIRTGRLDANAAVPNGQYPFFTCSKEISAIDTYSFDTECVLVAGNGDLNVKYYKGKFDAYQRTYVIENKENSIFYIKYIYYFMKRFILELKKQTVGGIIKFIKLGNLTDAKIPVLSMDKQLELIDFFDRFNKTIENKQYEMDILNDLVKSQFIEMFGDENNQMWPYVRLEEIGTCKNGMNFSYKSNGYKIHCLGVGDFKNNNIIFNTLELPNVELEQKPDNDYLLENEDIVFVRSNGNKLLVGRSVLVYPKDVPTIFSGFCIRFRKNANYVNSIYLLHALKTQDIRMKMHGRGANIQNLNQQILLNLSIPMPPKSIQDQFAAIVEQIDKSKYILQKQIDALQELLDSKMEEFFG